MTQKYKINGKEIEALENTQLPDGIYTDRFTNKINELIQALGEPVECKNCTRKPGHTIFVNSKDNTCVDCGKKIYQEMPMQASCLHGCAFPSISQEVVKCLSCKRIGFQDKLTENSGPHLIVEEKKKWDRRELNGGEPYFYVDMAGIVDMAIYNFNSHDEWRVQSGNCFETKEEAEAYKQKLIEDNK